MQTISKNENTVEPKALKKALPNAGVMKRISIPTNQMLRARLRQIQEETQK